jgi:hypothetical protein
MADTSYRCGDKVHSLHESASCPERPKSRLAVWRPMSRLRDVRERIVELTAHSVRVVRQSEYSTGSRDNNTGSYCIEDRVQRNELR